MFMKRDWQERERIDTFAVIGASPATQRTPTAMTARFFRSMTFLSIPFQCAVASRSLREQRDWAFRAALSYPNHGRPRAFLFCGSVKFSV